MPFHFPSHLTNPFHLQIAIPLCVLTSRTVFPTHSPQITCAQRTPPHHFLRISPSLQPTPAAQPNSFIPPPSLALFLSSHSPSPAAHPTPFTPPTSPHTPVSAKRSPPHHFLRIPLHCNPHPPLSPVSAKRSPSHSPPPSPPIAPLRFSTPSTKTCARPLRRLCGRAKISGNLMRKGRRFYGENVHVRRPADRPHAAS